ncbi:MAG: hydroxypyruvate reductase [Alphaproteobacteria bacterium]|nr:MAG: hydroxypyruvate reductase [Alphaproteobacteria bacterium]
MSDFARSFLTLLFNAAVGAADPAKIVAANLPSRPRGRTVVVGAGKGAAQLARAFEDLWDGPLDGTVVTRYGHGVACERIEVIEAGHPVPDASGLAAAARLIQRVAGLGPDDLVVALICGGGSALLPAPPPGFTLDDEVGLGKALLASGAPIAAMNTIRKHFSRIKGGRLAAAAHPAKVVSLIVSDIPGDDPAQVASGPTVPDGSTPEDALALADCYRIGLPTPVRAYLAGAVADGPMPGADGFARDEARVIASAANSLEAAAAAARQRGVDAAILSDAVEGEAREVAKVHAALAREVALRGRPFARPVVLLSGGETTVTVTGAGRGGRNTEFLLSLAAGIDGIAGISALAADTDGVDGTQDNAGAFADGTTVARLRAAGLDPRALLANNDAWTAFHALGDLFVPGPTGTNVNDLRAILIR